LIWEGAPPNATGARPARKTNLDRNFALIPNLTSVLAEPDPKVFDSSNFDPDYWFGPRCPHKLARLVLPTPPGQAGTMWSRRSFAIRGRPTADTLDTAPSPPLCCRPLVSCTPRLLLRGRFQQTNRCLLPPPLASARRLASRPPNDDLAAPALLRPGADVRREQPFAMAPGLLLHDWQQQVTTLCDLGLRTAVLLTPTYGTSHSPLDAMPSIGHRRPINFDTRIPPANQL